MYVDDQTKHEVNLLCGHLPSLETEIEFVRLTFK